ncbi:hypothetical protein K2Q02_01355 [Patescibacteria group bacterium]|nr:hypothetical protein [Patescibacteria group bacterium]
MARKLITFVTPSTGQWLIITEFDKELKAILYDPGKPEDNISKNIIKNKYNDDLRLEKTSEVSSLKILVWPRGLGLTKLRWTEFVTDIQSAKLEKVKDRITGLERKKYTSIKTFLNSNLAIGTREEWVPYLNKVETHPAVVEITSSDGGSVEMVINIALEILHPLLIKNVEDIIAYVTSFVVEAFRLWGANKSFKDLRSICTTDDKTIHDEIFDKLTPLNEKDFIEKGVWVNRVAVMEVAIAERSKDLLESEENVAKQKNNAAAAVHQKEIELELNQAQEARNASELKFRKEDADIKANLIEKSSEGLAKINKGWGKGGLKRLYIGSGNTNSMQSLVESTLQVQDFADSDTDKRRKPQQKNKKEGGSENV